MGYTVNTNDFVEKYFVMDPATDDLIFDGTKLRNDMVVLIERDEFRYPLKDRVEGRLDDNDRAQMLRYQRWAVVSDVVINMQNVTFIATYNDGSKRKINVATEHAWYVKKETMQDDDPSASSIDLPVVDVDWGAKPPRITNDLLTPAATSYSPFDRTRLPVGSGENVGTAPVPPSFTGHPRPLADTGTIPRISWKLQDEEMVEPAHFNSTREVWEQRNNGNAPIN